MIAFEWLSELLARLQDEHILVRRGSATQLAPAHLLDLDPEDWGRAAGVAAGYGCRWAGVWGEERGDHFLITACLEKAADHLLLRTSVPRSHPILTSHVRHYPGADRLERHLQDLLGVAFLDHPDARRWTRHAAWSDRFPLRKDFPREGTPQPNGGDPAYPFVGVAGGGVCEVPVGPVHAGIIEPGHFRFQIVGETILQLEQHLGYVHKGIEKIAEGRDATGLARLAARVSGDTAVGHGWAACMAMERAAGCAPPPRALALRAVCAERERIANHLGDIGAICNDVGFAFGHYQFARLRELWLRENAAHFGHRLLMDRVVPGGMAADLAADGIAALREGASRLRRELDEIYPILEDYPSLEDRLAGTGVLLPDAAARWGSLGYLGRASGQDRDLRRDRPYAPYHTLTVGVPVATSGDVAARLQVRAEEIRVSLQLLEALLADLPGGPIQAVFPAPAIDAEGFAAIEGWRGEILTYVRFDEQGRIARFFPRDPSWFSWPALEELILGNIVPDFPVCNKSVNGSYAGHDL